MKYLIAKVTALAAGGCLLLGMSACVRDKAAKAGDQPKAISTTYLPTSLDEQPVPTKAGPLPSIDANRTLQYVKEIVAFGPRPIGSSNHKNLEDYIYAHLKGDQVKDDAFTADTPEGKFPVRNIIAKFAGTRDGVVV